jgi:predicted nucleic acid-binding protein
LIPGTDDEEAQLILDRLRIGGAIVPQLWHYEVRNAMLVAERRGAIPQLAAELRIRGLSALPIVTDRDAVLDQAMELAIKHGLSYYDALYLELACRETIPLATLDRRLTAAAVAAGVESLCGQARQP